MTRIWRLKPVLTGLLATLAGAGTALACAFHNYTPDETLVDKLLGSEHIVLARADPDNPFRYQPVSAILGPLEGVDLPQLVDSQTRRRLAGNDADRVLFARTEPYGPWQRLAYVDDAYRTVLDRIVANLEAWQYGGDAERYQLFADLVDHPSTTLHLMALRELDRAPYDLLTALRFSPDAEAILARMYDPQMAEFLPIHILLLGLSDHGAAAEALQAGLDRTLHEQQSPFIGAWATALIELQGADAVERIGQRMLTDTTLIPDTREALVEALAIHALADQPGMAAQINALMARALAQDAAFAPMVARQWGSRAMWDQADALTELLHGGALTTAEAVISVSHYLSFARQMSQDAAVSSN